MEAKLLSFNGVPSLRRASCIETRTKTHKVNLGKSMFCLSSNCQRQTQSKSHQFSNPKISTPRFRNGCGFTVMSYSSSSTPNSSAKLYVSGLSFRTTEDSLRNAFQKFGQLVEVNLVMDKRANRPRGFAFLYYETEEESQKAIEGMHGKFLDGRVIFVEVSKPRSELRVSPDPSSRRY